MYIKYIKYIYIYIFTSPFELIVPHLSHGETADFNGSHCFTKGCAQEIISWISRLKITCQRLTVKKGRKYMGK